MLTVNYIAVEADKGVTLHAAFRAALIMALTESKPVQLSFNHKLYLLKPNDILSQLALQAEVLSPCS